MYNENERGLVVASTNNDTIDAGTLSIQEIEESRPEDTSREVLPPITDGWGNNNPPPPNPLPLSLYLEINREDWAYFMLTLLRNFPASPQFLLDDKITLAIMNDNARLELYWLFENETDGLVPDIARKGYEGYEFFNHTLPAFQHSVDVEPFVQSWEIGGEFAPRISIPLLLQLWFYGDTALRNSTARKIQLVFDTYNKTMEIFLEADYSARVSYYV